MPTGISNCFTVGTDGVDSTSETSPTDDSDDRDEAFFLCFNVPLMLGLGDRDTFPREELRLLMNGFVVIKGGFIAVLTGEESAVL